ncbi:uncharacterized protein C15orf39 homolog isoform X1 [Solea solea]|uniref:uncharacterized protein C15orf39 homolog isoform X1 n=1 Tax=Solea solea TaxID=90069 RepID=UPI002729655B|nr:uncharacterized protein C15orf39 homolog isoform X1 [Solea solea]
MPLFDGTITPTVPPKPQNMQDFLHKQALQYSGVYFAYDPRRREGAGFPVLDGRNPASHLSGMEGHNHIFYRQEKNSPEEEHSHSSVCHAPVKQGFALYTKSPGSSNATASASVTVGEPKTGGENLPPPSENSIYLAVPKPVYGHSPCCNEVGCVMGRYSVEHGSLRIPKNVYQHDWMQSDGHYTERQPIERKTQDTLLQQRGLQYEHSAEPLKRISVETYSPSPTRTLPAMIDPNYSGYPCTPTRTLLNSLSERSQRLQASPRSYPSLYPSHPTYEHMTSEVYQERSPMSKYGQLTQYPVFYYPQANEEPQNSTQCKSIGSKQREDVPVILKHTISNPREHYIVPQSLHGEIPLPRSETLPNHSFLQGFDYPCYAVPRINLNASQIRVPLTKQHPFPSFHSNGINVSPSSQHRDHPLTSAVNLHKDKPNTSLHVEQPNPSSPFLCRNLSSSTRCTNHPGVSPPNIKTSRFFPSISSLLVDQHVCPPGGLNMNRLMDYPPCESHVPWPEQPKYLPVSPGAWLPRPPSQSSDRIHTAVSNGANVRKIIYSPAVPQGNNNNSPISTSGTTVIKGCLKRSVSHPSPPIKIKEESRDFCEVDSKKRQKLEVMEKVKVENNAAKHPMPVIDSVFSLAQYQTYLQGTRIISAGQVPQSTGQSSEDGEVKIKPEVKLKMPDRDEEQPVVSVVPHETCPDTPIEQPVVEIPKHKNIKLEKVDSTDADDAADSLVSQQEYSKVIIKQEPEEADLYDGEHMLVIEKCEADEPEYKASYTDEKKTSDEAKPVELTTPMHSSSDTYTPHEQAATLQSTPSTPMQVSESNVDFKNVPPQYLKLTAVRILLPDIKYSSPAPPPEKSPVQPTADGAPKLELQTPARKHFLELHNSLCKLVSKSVSASSEQELKAWLSQLQLTDPTSPSTKVQKVSCLLGVNAREKWLNEEMTTALHKVLERLREYTSQKRCPFPHVMRAGAVFLPMLVMKELLFPVVQGTFIDQVLHEHKVELRPTTLSEEKILIQLHKRACSSRLRRLMSLKHLPDIYADVVNLLYHACVCKHLGLEVDDPAKGEDNVSEETPVFSKFSASPVSPPESHPQKPPKDQETKSHLNRKRTKSRVKSSSRRMFLDSTLSDEEAAAGDMEKNSVFSGFCRTNLSDQSADGENRGNNSLDSELDSSLVPQSPTPDNSWTCPLTLDQLSPSPSDTVTEDLSTLQPGIRSSGSASSPVDSKNCSGMILKLRKMFGSTLHKRAHYQAVSYSGTYVDPSVSKTGDGEEGVSNKSNLCRMPKANHRWQRTGSISHTLRPLNPSKGTCRPHSKIKYCPYLSACHSAEHRRRWVLRSAVQRARKAIRIHYPDLVGKRIRHLYEEDDKSEVWYSGEVVRIHEANTNPLKTIFEVRYDSEPEWKYYLELLIDYKKGWLKVED